MIGTVGGSVWPCARCAGWGHDPWREEPECPLCDGMGSVALPLAPSTWQRLAAAGYLPDVYDAGWEDEAPIAPFAAA